MSGSEVRTEPTRAAASMRVALLLAIVALLSVNAGLMRADASSAQFEPTRIATASAAAAEPWLDPVGGAAFALVDAVDLSLPDPADLPDNPYEATPEVRHGTIEIPAIGLSDTFYEGVSLTAINRGPSHWPGTALPGELGNVVVAGHRTTYSHPFFDLDLLQPGDELIFTTESGRFVYELTRTEVVPFDGVHILDQKYDRTATLFACHPKGSARYRIVGHFRLAASSPAGS